MNGFSTIRPAWLLCFLISFATGLLMVSSESLWIDEGQTWQFARLSSFSDWLAALLSNTKSEAQMPLSMFLAWLGARIIGDGEWQLRSLNVLWIGLAGVALCRISRTAGGRYLLPLFLVHPFVWYYANEARPYALIICVGAWLLSLWVSVHESGALTTGRLWLVGIIATIGLASSLLFAFALVGFGFAFVAIIVVRKIRFDKRHLIPIAVTGLAMVGLMGYYFWTLTHGATGAKIWSVGLSNVAFAFYELLGFGGLGPPRHELRELARSAGGAGILLSQGRYLAGIAILAALYLMLVPWVWKLRRDSLARIAAGTVVVSAGGILGASLVVGFPFWGRHLAFVLPAIAFLMARSMESAFASLKNVPVYLLFICLLASSLFQRFLPQYRKDDYRSASRLATAALASGKTVWWVADHITAGYYGLRVPTDNPARLIAFNNESALDITNKPAPDLIFVSKPDVHDPQRKVVPYIQEHAYRPIAELTAFRVYSRSAQD